MVYYPMKFLVLLKKSVEIDLPILISTSIICILLLLLS